MTSEIHYGDCPHRPGMHGIPGCERNLGLAQALRQAGGAAFQTLDLPTDHFFADYRLWVADRVTDFLTQQL